MFMCLIRNKVYPAEEILSKTLFIPKSGKMRWDKYEKRMIPQESGKHNKVLIDGELINMASDRYKIFSFNRKCVCCGLEGTIMAMEKGDKDSSFHFNLYGLDSDGKEILFTKDHIVPKSKGGKNSIDNYQTMCIKCNEKKSNN